MADAAKVERLTSSYHCQWRRVRSWLRSPRFYARKARRRIFGTDLSFLSRERGDYPIGSWEWLALSEKQYGGFQTSASASALAESDGMRDGQDAKGKLCLGGDRMSPVHHGYAETYAEFLNRFVQRGDKLMLLEIGILNGSGLAVWCDLFPRARVIGLDIDLRNYKCSVDRLRAQGAFSANTPEVYEFNQLDAAVGQSVLNRVLGEQKVDIVIDDGCHSIASIESTFEIVKPYLADRFTYFIEDNFDSYDVMATKHPRYEWTARGELTVAEEA